MNAQGPNPTKDGRRWAIWAVATVVISGFAACLIADYPGHFPPDALWQLAQGRAGHYNTWHPPVMAWLLGVADRLSPGAWAFVLFDGGLFYGGLFAFVALERPPRLACVPVLLVWMLSPTVLILQGVVVKDVLFADAAMAGFAALAWAGRQWARPAQRYGLLAVALALFALAALTRQNGMILLPFATAALLAIVMTQDPGNDDGRRRAVRAATFALTGLTLTSLCVVGVNTVLDARADGRPENVNHLKVLQMYDLAGELQAEPSAPLGVLRARQPSLERFLRMQAAPRFRAAGADNLFAAPGGDSMMIPPGSAVGPQWWAAMTARPDVYLRVRAAIWLTTLTTPPSALCPMIITGVDDGDPELLARAGLSGRDDAKDDWDADYASAFLPTPLYSHLFYAAGAAAALLWAAWRWRQGDRGPEAVTMIAMVLAGAAFAGSFFVISIDCDYRFLYFLDVATMAAIARLSAASRLRPRTIAT